MFTALNVEKLFIAIILTSVIFSGCVEETQTEVQPSFTIRAPAEGQVVGPSVNVVLDVKNIILVGPTGNVNPNRGHFHLFLDNMGEIEGPQISFTYSNVTAGRHAIRVELRRGDHSQFDPPITKNVSFIVP
jgi:hypothetical protein